MTGVEEKDAATPRREMPRITDEFSYQATLRAAFGALLLLIFLSGSLFYYSFEESRYYHQRSQLADDVLKAYLELSALINRSYGEIAQAALGERGSAGDVATDPTGEIRGAIARIRELIGNEVLHVGSEEDERDELASLEHLEMAISSVFADLAQTQALDAEGNQDAVQSHLARIFAQRDNVGLQRLIDDAIAEERREATHADSSANALIRRIEIYSSIATALIFAFSAFIFVALLRRLRFSFSTLSDGADAIASGSLDHRIPQLGDRDFDLLGLHFNRMAKDLRKDRQNLLKAQAELEDKVADRTAQLEAANIRLEEIDRTRRRFLADIGHELRTPLTVIRGEGEIALRGGDKEAEVYQKSLQRVVEQTGHTTRLLDDLLFMVRSSEGEVSLSSQPIPLREALEDAVSAFETIAADRNISIKLQSDGLPATVLGDRNRLRQTFVALIDNALRYSKPLGEIRVRLGRHPSGYEVTVKDNGIGISEEDLELVFERFYRGENAIRQAEGTGLGLPVAKAIVDAHGGKISLESSPGNGMTATVILPNAEEPPTAA